MTTAQERELVELALAYPFAIPGESFVLRGEGVGHAAAASAAAGEIALLAYGSNASPAVLSRKLGASSRAAPVTVRRARLRRYDVVYSAHFSLYGSIPATLQPSPATEATAAVAFLSARQLELIAATEPNYDLVELDWASCSLEQPPSAAQACRPPLLAFVSRHGSLRLGAVEVAVAEIEARGRSFPAMSQRQVQARVRDMLDPALSLERFVVGSASDPALAATRTRRLSSCARSASMPAARSARRRR